MIKKCSLAVIGKVSAPASRIQENGYRECIKTGRWSGPVTGSGALGVGSFFGGKLRMCRFVSIIMINKNK
jgi:hypothetical protein